MATFFGGGGGGVTSITGTSNQITVTGTTTPTLSTPQDIHTAATPTFGTLLLNGGVSSLGYLYLGGQTSSDACIRKHGTGAKVLLGDLSASGDWSCAALTASVSVNAADHWQYSSDFMDQGSSVHVVWRDSADISGTRDTGLKRSAAGVVKATDGSAGFGKLSTSHVLVDGSIDTTAGDSATINKAAGRFRKDATGATFTLTNSFISANSIVLLTPANAAIDATATSWTVSAGSGSATITFNAAPTSNFDMNFLVIN